MYDIGELALFTTIKNISAGDYPTEISFRLHGQKLSAASGFVRLRGKLCPIN